jgi:hypothetical protein
MGRGNSRWDGAAVSPRRNAGPQCNNPTEEGLSVVFGGPDLCDLYVVTGQSRRMRGSIYRARSDIPGLTLPLALLDAPSR